MLLNLFYTHIFTLHPVDGSKCWYNGRINKVSKNYFVMLIEDRYYQFDWKTGKPIGHGGDIRLRKPDFDLIKTYQPIAELEVELTKINQKLEKLCKLELHNSSLIDLELKKQLIENDILKLSFALYNNKSPFFTTNEK